MADETEALRRAGLFLGPAVLGLVVGNGLYRAACESTGFVLIAGTSQAAFINIPFCIAAIYLVWRIRDPIGRAAFVILAFQQLVLAYGAVAETTVNRLLVGMPTVFFAALLTILGVRHTTRRRTVTIAIAAFAAMFLFSWGGRHYSNVFTERLSVVGRGPIC